MTSVLQTGAARLRQLLKDTSKIVVAPGVYDGFTARLALNAGFDAIYMTGFGTSLSRIGWPDLGLASLPDMRANADMIANLDASVPLIADADTGYGGPLAVARTITQYAQSGVAALHLEDQVQTKRCGHLLGKELVSSSIFHTRIRAASSARQKGNLNILIIARTDSLASLGFSESISRLQGAVEAGADIVFLEGVRTEEEARKVCEIMAPTPVLLNLVPGGVTPNWSMQKAKELGFRIVIVPVFLLEEVEKSCSRALRRLREEGDAEGEDIKGPRGLSALCGLDEAMRIDKEAGGSSLGDI